MANFKSNGQATLWVIGVVVVVIIAAGSFLVLRGGSEVAGPSGTTVSTEREDNVPTEDGDSSARRTGEEVPDFSLQNFAGETVSLSDFKGKPLVLNSWAVWCPFCVKELGDFVTVQQEFGDQVKFVPIDRAESLAVAKEFTDSLGITDDLIFLLDPKDSFYTAIGGFSMPETLFVTADGEVQFHKRGPMDAAEIRQRVQALLDS